METRGIKTIVAVAFAATLMVSAHANADTISLDLVSPTAVDPADLLNPGLSVQVTRGALGLGAGDEVDALASGSDAVQFSNVVYFSVDRASAGVQAAGLMAPFDVYSQAQLNQQAGDVYASVNGVMMGSIPQGLNLLMNNQNLFGQSPRRAPYYDNTGALQDNLDALSFEEYDLDGDSVTDRGTYFSLATGSPSLGAASPADILYSAAGSNGFAVFAAAAQMGLAEADEIDALAVLDLDGDGVASQGDAALFSLTAGSPTAQANNISGADLLLTRFNGTSAVRYQAAAMGLLAEDNIDGLEVQVPEPATLGVMVLGAVIVLARRRRK